MNGAGVIGPHVTAETGLLGVAGAARVLHAATVDDNVADPSVDTRELEGGLLRLENVFYLELGEPAIATPVSRRNPAVVDVEYRSVVVLHRGVSGVGH